ncbi:MAG: multicopper oxidase domain-containing protein, partial [Gemmatimonadaceae bacterium]
WRWVNASNRSHPMHLHGFHFLVTATGTGQRDSLYAPESTRLAVTELVQAGRTFALEWVPRRAGNWLTHCHMIPHIVPHPKRPDSSRAHDVHDYLRHPLESMAGLVLGVTTSGDDVAPESRAPAKTHRRLFIQQSSDTSAPWKKGFVLQRGLEPRPDSVEIPGAPLVVTRGEKVSVTVVNRLKQASSVHWRGMELESVFDGVAGYSGIGNTRAPLIAPGDSFTVSFTPPRAGTYMYHTHMDEEDQLTAGLYGPIIVLEPGERYDPSRDFSFTMGVGPNPAPAKRGRALNGSLNPPPRTLKAGLTYRLRLINLGFAEAEGFRLTAADSSEQTWRLISKDGAAVTGKANGPARQLVGVGESYDFEWTPKAGEAFLIAQLGRSVTPFGGPRVQRFIVEP